MVILRSWAIASCCQLLPACKLTTVANWKAKNQLLTIHRIVNLNRDNRFRHSQPERGTQTVGKLGVVWGAGVSHLYRPNLSLEFDVLGFTAVYLEVKRIHGNFTYPQDTPKKISIYLLWKTCLISFVHVASCSIGANLRIQQDATGHVHWCCKLLPYCHEGWWPWR